MKNFKSFISGFLVSSVLFTALTFAFAKHDSLQVFFNDIKIQVNNKLIEQEKGYEPFIYNGRTFLPIRAVTEQLNCTVKWNETTNTVEITSNSLPSLPQNLNQIQTDNLNKESVIPMTTNNEIQWKTFVNNQETNLEPSAIEINNDIYILGIIINKISNNIKYDSKTKQITINNKDNTSSLILTQDMYKIYKGRTYLPKTVVEYLECKIIIDNENKTINITQ